MSQTMPLWMVRYMAENHKEISVYVGSYAAIRSKHLFRHPRLFNRLKCLATYTTPQKLWQ